MAPLSEEEFTEFLDDCNFLSLRKTCYRYSQQLIVFYKISGYHHFHNRPLIGTPMLMKCVREPENRFDRFSVKVIAPTLDDIHFQYHHDETRPYPRRQLVSDVAGKMIGRVPSKICKVLSTNIENGNIIHCHAIFTGNIIHDGPIIGGGPKLECFYILQIVNSEILAKVKEELTSC